MFVRKRIFRSTPTAFFFFSSRRRHTRYWRDWSSDVCSSDLPQFAKLATLRFTLILPAVLGIVYIGAFEATRSWGDLFALLGFGVVGWLMKQFRDRKSTRLNSSHANISYAVFCLKKKNNK